MDVATFKLTSIQDVVRIGTVLSSSWFRGHARVHGTLVPRAFRYDRLFEELRPDHELTFLDAFMRRAPALASETPAPDDRIGWMLLAQHHGVPTRLLDWSANVLVALYFAVCGRPKEDGELWALYAQNLNRAGGVGPHFPLSNNPVLRFFVNQPFHSTDTILATQLGLSEVPPGIPTAFIPPMSFPRLVAQSGRFTIHPLPAEGTPIEGALAGEPKSLCRYVIPAKSKHKLLADLAALGISEGSLFLTLDHLSVDLEREHNVVAYSPPDPPDCDGRWNSPSEPESV